MPAERPPVEIHVTELKKESKDVEYILATDIHGNFEDFKKIVDALPPHVVLKISGDIVDKGPDSWKVVEYILQLQKTGQRKIIVSRGNHEEMCLAAIAAMECLAASMYCLCKSTGEDWVARFENLLKGIAKLGRYETAQAEVVQLLGIDPTNQQVIAQANSLINPVKDHFNQNLMNPEQSWMVDRFVNALKQKAIVIAEAKEAVNGVRSINIEYREGEHNFGALRMFLSNMPYMMYYKSPTRQVAVAHANMPCDDARFLHLVATKERMTDQERDNSMWENDSASYPLQNHRGKVMMVAGVGHVIVTEVFGDPNRTTTAVREETCTLNLDQMFCVTGVMAAFNITKWRVELHGHGKVITMDNIHELDDPSYLADLPNYERVVPADQRASLGTSREYAQVRKRILKNSLIEMSRFLAKHKPEEVAEMEHTGEAKAEEPKPAAKPKPVDPAQPASSAKEVALNAKAHALKPTSMMWQAKRKRDEGDNPCAELTQGKGKSKKAKKKHEPAEDAPRDLRPGQRHT